MEVDLEKGFYTVKTLGELINEKGDTFSEKQLLILEGQYAGMISLLKDMGVYGLFLNYRKPILEGVTEYDE